MALNSMSIIDFKNAVGGDKIEVLQNPKTGKWFFTCNGKNYRCHQSTDWNTKPRNISILVEDGDLDGACLVPSGLGAKVAATY